MGGVAIEGTKLTPSNVRDATVNFILDAEGSAYVADDAGAGESKYGITAQFNPGVDVKNLTREGAAQIYREKYWSAVNGDNLPPALAAVMADTAVNLGAGRAKELLQQSGGDVNTLLDLRREHYKTLIANNPEKYGRFEKGWNNRVNKLQAFVSSQEVTNVPTVDLTKNAPQNNPASENILQWLPITEQLSFLRQAQTVIKQDQALVQKQFQERISNANAMAVDGIQDPKPLTSADFFKAFEPDEAAKQFESYQTNQKLAETMSTFKTQSASEIATELSLWQPKPGEDYAIAEKRFNILQQAAVNIAKQRKDDPATFSLNSSPVVQEAYTYMEDVVRTPNASTLEINRAANDYVTKSRAEQERLGIVNPKILTNPMMEDLSRRMNAGNESAGDIAVSLQQMYGKKHFAQILSEMNEKNKLPSAMMVIGDLMDNPAALELASRLSKVKASELETGIDGATVKTIKESVTQYILPLRISAGNAEGRTVAQINAYEDMMLKMAYQQIGSGATTSGTQAAKNANELLLGKYQFVGTLRMPKGLDATQVTRGLDRVVREQVLTVDPKSTTLDVPVDFTNARTKEEALAEWQSTVRSRYMWISDNDTKAANLWAQGQNGIFYAVKKEGKQISVPFDEAIRANIRTIEDVRKRVDPMQLQRQRLAEETRRLQLEMEQE
jgi:lysozyme family protein